MPLSIVMNIILLIPTFSAMVEKEVSHYDDGSFSLNSFLTCGSWPLGFSGATIGN
jgi:hypothetical protein